MAVITFANTKGGAGKTTAVLIVASELERMGYTVAVLDADPQNWISRWYEQLGDRKPSRLTVISYVSVDNLERLVRQWKVAVDFVLIDLPGARSTLLAQALGHSHYVLIPVQGSTMDAQGGANVIELLQYLELKADIRIPHSVVLTRVSPLVTTKALQAVKALLTEKRVHMLSTPIIDRAAFRDVFGSGETLYSMDPRRVSNLERAHENARMLGEELVLRLMPYTAVDQVQPAKLQSVA